MAAKPWLWMLTGFRCWGVTCKHASMGHSPIRVCLLQHEDNISHRSRKRRLATVRAVAVPKGPTGSGVQTTGWCQLLGRCHRQHRAGGVQTNYQLGTWQALAFSLHGEGVLGQKPATASAQRVVCGGSFVQGSHLGWGLDGNLVLQAISQKEQQGMLNKSCFPCFPTQSWQRGLQGTWATVSGTWTRENASHRDGAVERKNSTEVCCSLSSGSATDRSMTYTSITSPDVSGKAHLNPRKFVISLITILTV